MTTDIVPADAYGDLGLEDIDESDLSVPRLTIDHDNITFVNSLTKETFEKLFVVPLGVVKQRVLWQPGAPEEDSSPLCKSYENKVGRPDQNAFPWEASGFTKGTEELSCATCPLKEWGSHPNEDKPWCTEQWSVPMFVARVEEKTIFPAIMTFQRTSLPPIKKYASAFKGVEPIFVAVAQLTLQAERKGKREYGVIEIKRLKQSDASQYEMFANTYRSIRSFLQTPPQRDDAEAEAPKPAAKPAATKASKPKAPEPEPETGVSEAELVDEAEMLVAATGGKVEEAVVEDEEDLPF